MCHHSFLVIQRVKPEKKEHLYPQYEELKHKALFFFLKREMFKKTDNGFFLNYQYSSELSI